MALLECPRCHEMIHAPKGQLRRLAHEQTPVRVASRSRPHFHRAECQWAAEIPEWNLIAFEDREAAISAGLKPCKTCCA